MLLPDVCCFGRWRRYLPWYPPPARWLLLSATLHALGRSQSGRLTDQMASEASDIGGIGASIGASEHRSHRRSEVEGGAVGSHSLCVLPLATCRASGACVCMCSQVRTTFSHGSPRRNGEADQVARGRTRAT
jgi:hypothetical protein